jgi:hypothetical protein
MTNQRETINIEHLQNKVAEGTLLRGIVAFLTRPCRLTNKYFVRWLPMMETLVMPLLR